MIKQLRIILAPIAFILLQQPVLADNKPKDYSKEIEGVLSVMVLGSGGPVAMPSGRASAGYMIFTDGKPRILMDVGGGTYQRLAASGINIHDMDIILLSHLHLDHTGDLGSIIKTIYFHNNGAQTSRTNPIHIYGPEESRATFPNTNISQYPATSKYADDHFALPDGSDRYLNLFAGAISQGASKFNYKSHDLKSLVPGAIVEEVLRTADGLLIEAIAVDHGPVPAVAYRIEYKGHSIVYSGDTASNGANMVTISRDADLLIYDTAITETLPPIPVFHVLHTSPTRIGQVAFEANVKKLVLSHITPNTEPRMESIKETIRSQGYTGKIKVAKDLKVYNLGDGS
jgi:ribonuclease BN (tRNA processing enzyme)